LTVTLTDADFIVTNGRGNSFVGFLDITEVIRFSMSGGSDYYYNYTDFDVAERFNTTALMVSGTASQRHTGAPLRHAGRTDRNRKSRDPAVLTGQLLLLLEDARLCNGEALTMFHRRLAVPVCLAAALVLPEMAGPMSSAAPRHLLLITLDTMRADRLPAYGFTGVETHALDRIAAEGAVFEEAFAAVPLTLPSHSALLTGIYPPRVGVSDNASPPLAPASRRWRRRCASGV